MQAACVLNYKRDSLDWAFSWTEHSTSRCYERGRAGTYSCTYWSAFNKWCDLLAWGNNGTGDSQWVQIFELKKKFHDWILLFLCSVNWVIIPLWPCAVLLGMQCDMLFQLINLDISEIPLGMWAILCLFWDIFFWKDLCLVMCFFKICFLFPLVMTLFSYHFCRMIYTWSMMSASCSYLHFNFTESWLCQGAMSFLMKMLQLDVKNTQTHTTRPA